MPSLKEWLGLLAVFALLLAGLGWVLIETGGAG